MCMYDTSPPKSQRQRQLAGQGKSEEIQQDPRAPPLSQHSNTPHAVPARSPLRKINNVVRREHSGDGIRKNWSLLPHPASKEQQQKRIAQSSRQKPLASPQNYLSIYCKHTLQVVKPVMNRQSNHLLPKMKAIPFLMIYV